MCILDLSKVLIYKFCYGYIKNKYGNNLRLLFTYTDSLMYTFKIEVVFKDFNKDKEIFDFSKYLPNLKYYDDLTKLVVCKTKDETAGVAIKELVGSNPKMYSSLVDYNNEHKKTKGVN